jgi:DNA-directed RNA polymerase specialized sigma24 family protein
MSEFHSQIRQLTADRHSPEARALYATLAGYVERRVAGVARYAAPDLLGACEREEIVADVLFQLVAGSLAQFRGDTIGELTAFVRTITDRSLWRRIRRKVREKRALDEQRPDVEAWSSPSLRPDDLVHMVPDLPLPAEDEAYLRALIEAGSKAELARQRNLSRAAVTQRVQRIRSRIDRLEPQQQLAVDAWLHQAAREALDRG